MKINVQAELGWISELTFGEKNDCPIGGRDISPSEEDNQQGHPRKVTIELLEGLKNKGSRLIKGDFQNCLSGETAGINHIGRENHDAGQISAEVGFGRMSPLGGYSGFIANDT